MLYKTLKNHNIILASGSPRRQQFFKDLGLDFEIRLKPVEEIYPEELIHAEISDYLAQLKSKPFKALILTIQNESMDKQKELIDETFENWRGLNEQVDDLCVIGVRI